MPKKSKKVRKSKPKHAKVDPIPKGFGTVTPYLSVDRAAEALEWYKKAFGAKELDRETVPGGKIMHARIRIGDSIIMLSDVDNQFWGERYGKLKDPFGHNWSLSQRISMTKAEMKEKQEQAMAMFSQGEHPGAEEQAPMAQ